MTDTTGSDCGESDCGEMEPQDAIARVPPLIPVGSVLSNEHPCSYLPGKTANLPLILPANVLSMRTMDAALAAGMRRAGLFLYYTQCQGCQSCEPTRFDVHQFRWTESWKRILKRGDRQLQLAIAPTSMTDEKLALFNRHRVERGLNTDESNYQREDYESFLVETSCQFTMELQFRIGEQLIAVSIIDCGQNSVSAVYTYFDPDYSKLSIGTYAILKQLEFCLQTGRQYVYLGMYVKDNSHLNYKARFLPQQRWMDGGWVNIDHNSP